MGFTKSEADPKLYYILVGDNALILVLYVDDIFSSEKLIEVCKRELGAKVQMKDIIHDAINFVVEGVAAKK